MEFATLITWAIGLVVLVLTGAWGRTANKIARNNEATAELRAQIAEVRGRQTAHEAQMQVLLEEVRNSHQRIGGVAQTVNRIEGQVTGLTNTMTPIVEHLLQRERPSA